MSDEKLFDERSWLDGYGTAMEWVIEALQAEAEWCRQQTNPGYAAAAERTDHLVDMIYHADEYCEPHKQFRRRTLVDELVQATRDEILNGQKTDPA